MAILLVAILIVCLFASWTQSGADVAYSARDNSDDATEAAKHQQDGDTALNRGAAAIGLAMLLTLSFCALSGAAEAAMRGELWR